jgi:hypothetical protein
MKINHLRHSINRDHYGGGLMFLLGVGAVLEGITYKIGTLGHMGPGFFPVALGVILALTGLAIALSGTPAVPAVEEKKLPPEWRGWLCIVSSIAVFVILGKYGGLLPATFAIVFISALGDRQNTFKSALVLALVMCVICVVIFSWALKMQFPLFQWG